MPPTAYNNPPITFKLNRHRSIFIGDIVVHLFDLKFHLHFSCLCTNKHFLALPGVVLESERVYVFLQGLIETSPHNVQFIVQDGGAIIALLDMRNWGQMHPFPLPGKAVSYFVGDSTHTKTADFENCLFHSPARAITLGHVWEAQTSPSLPRIKQHPIGSSWRHWVAIGLGKGFLQDYFGPDRALQPSVLQAQMQDVFQLLAGNLFEMDELHHAPRISYADIHTTNK